MTDKWFNISMTQQMDQMEKILEHRAGVLFRYYVRLMQVGFTEEQAMTFVLQVDRVNCEYGMKREEQQDER